MTSFNKISVNWVKQGDEMLPGNYQGTPKLCNRHRNKFRKDPPNLSGCKKDCKSFVLSELSDSYNEIELVHPLLFSVLSPWED